MTVWDDILRAQVDQVTADIQKNLFAKSPIHDMLTERRIASNLLWGNQPNKWETQDYLTKWSNE